MGLVLFLWLAINISSEPQEFALIKRLRFISGQPLGLKHCLCGPIYTPVCGSDGKTYPNICTAMCKVTVMKCLGKCPCTPQEVEKNESKSENNITVGSKSVSSTAPPNIKDDLFQ